MCAWLHNVQELSLVTVLSFHCLLRLTEARQLRWCDVKFFDGSLSTRYGKLYGIVIISEPKTRRMAGHAAQQHVLLECPGICQLVNTMKSSIPDHRLDTAIWRFTAAQHFAYFQRQLRSLGVSHQHYTLHGVRGGGATEHWLQYRDLPQLRRRGRWASVRTIERYIQEGTFLLQNLISKEVADRLSALADLAPRFFAEHDYGESHHRHQQPPRCNGKCGEVHSVSPLGALPLPLGDVGRKQRTSRRRTRYEHRHTGMDYVVSRVRRSRLGAATLFSNKKAVVGDNSGFVEMCAFSQNPWQSM